VKPIRTCWTTYFETVQTHNGSKFLLSSPFYTIIPKGKVGVITDHTKGLRTINNSHECWDCIWGWWSHAFSSHFLDQSWPTVAALLAPSAPDSLKQPPAFVPHCFLMSLRIHLLCLLPRFHLPHLMPDDRLKDHGSLLVKIAARKLALWWGAKTCKRKLRVSAKSEKSLA